MSKTYADVVAVAAKLVTQAILEREPDLVRRARNVDSIVLGVLRDVGFSSTEGVLNATAAGEAARVASGEGLTVQHRKRTPFLPSSEKSKLNRRTCAIQRQK
ncbi:MAG: hypothetical protein AAB658_08960 [Chloroflexota bacterium]